MIQKAFGSPAYTIKSGVVIVKDGVLQCEYWGRTFWVDLKDKVTESIESDLDEYFNYYTIERSNYGVEERWIRNPARVGGARWYNAED